MKKKNPGVTESPSRYSDLELKSVKELLASINKEDQSVPLTVKKVIPRLNRLIPRIIDKMKNSNG